MPFSASAVFCFTSFILAKHLLLRTFFIWGNKKVPWGETEWIRRVGNRGHAVFGQKLLNTHCSVGRCACNSPTMKWAKTLKESKKFTEAECSLSQQCQLVWGALSHRDPTATTDENKSTKTWSAWGGKADQSLRGEKSWASLSMGFYWV